MTGQEPAQVVRQGGSREVAAVGLLVEAFEADGLQVSRQVVAQPRGGDRLGPQHLAEQITAIVPLERRAAGEQLVQDGPQRVDIDGRAQLADLARGLFRSHVGWRAQDGAGLSPGGVCAGELGEAEVGDPGLVSGE
jgi:hypothetical protein